MDIRIENINDREMNFILTRVFNNTNRFMYRFPINSKCDYSQSLILNLVKNFSTYKYNYFDVNIDDLNNCLCFKFSFFSTEQIRMFINVKKVEENLILEKMKNNGYIFLDKGFSGRENFICLFFEKKKEYKITTYDFLVNLIIEYSLKNIFIYGYDEDRVTFILSKAVSIASIKENVVDIRNKQVDSVLVIKGKITKESMELIRKLSRENTGGYLSLYNDYKDVFFNNWDCEYYIDDSIFSIEELIINDCNAKIYNKNIEKESYYMSVITGV